MLVCCVMFMFLAIRRRGQEEWVDPIFIRNRSSASFYYSNFNILFFKMFSYLIFTLDSNLFEGAELCFLSIFFFLGVSKRNWNESYHLLKNTLYLIN